LGSGTATGAGVTTGATTGLATGVGSVSPLTFEGLSTLDEIGAAVLVGRSSTASEYILPSLAWLP
jgi:hypothetical protein